MNILKAREELMMGKTIYDMNLKVADYGRVSTDKEQQINSLENQVNYFSDLIKNVKTWTHVRSYIDEGISGTQVRKRDQFLKMIEDAKLGKIDLILTKEVSRFARNTVDSISYTQLLLKYGTIVYFISDNINTIYPDSEFRLALMASMAQDEVRKLSERVKFGIKRSIKDRKLGGGSLYGYTKKDGKLIINEQEKKAVEMLYNLYSTGEYGFRKIGDMLAKNGYYTKKGKIFSDTTLKKMLKNPRYKGYYTANMSEIEDYKTHKKINKPKEEWIIEKDEKGNVPSIVTEEIWNKANQILEERTKIWNKNVLNKEFYLEHRKYTSKIICTEHNKTFIRTASGKRKENPVWQCNEFLRHGIKGCKTPRLFEKQLDQIFEKKLEEIIYDKKEIILSLKDEYFNLIKEEKTIKNNKYIKEKLIEYDRIKEKLLDMSLKNMITDSEFIEKNKEITNGILKLKTLSKEDSNNILKKIEEEIEEILNIKNNIGKYFELFIDKVYVKKINNDRKNIILKIKYNFEKEDEQIILNMNK